MTEYVEDCRGCGAPSLPEHLHAGGYCVCCLEPEAKWWAATPESIIDSECVACGAVIYPPGELCRRCEEEAHINFGRVFI